MYQSPMIKAEFSARLRKVVVSIKGLQVETHRLLLAAVAEAWHSNNYNWMGDMLNALHEVNGSFNFVGLAEYMQEYCGALVTEKNGAYTIKKNKDFQRGKKAWIRIVNNPWYIVKKRINPLSLPTESGIAKSIAKLVLAEEINLDDLIKHLQKDAVNAQADEKVVEWVKVYKEQQKEAA